MLWDELEFDYSSFLACFIKDYFTYTEMYDYLPSISNIFYQFIKDDPFLNKYLCNFTSVSWIIFGRRNIINSHKSKTILINRKSEGEYIRWHDNGKIFILGNLKNSKREDEWKFYYADGQVRTRNFKNNKLIKE